MVMSEEASPSEAAARPPRATTDDILRVASFKDRDPVREAMVVAAVYHRLAGDISARLGGTVNWYGFATWSSKTVAECLDLTTDSPFLAQMRSRLNVPRRFRRPFRAWTLLLLGPSYQLGMALANRTIFLETGSLAASLPLGDPAAGPAPSLGYRLHAPDPPGPPAPSGGGQPGAQVRFEFISSLLGPADAGHLDTAAALLTEAAETSDPARRAELILGANVALSAFEQARAQVLLELTMYRPCRWLTRVSWRWLLSAVTRRPFHRLWLYTTPHERMPWPIRHMETLWAMFYTRFTMSLRTAISEIRLGRRLKPPEGCDVEKAFAPIEDARVRELVETFVPDPGRATAGVANWLDYAERMRFIVAYFRMYLSVDAMLGPPFSPRVMDELEREMALGSIPEPVYSQWFRAKQRKYDDRANRPGVRGWIVRKFYRSPIDFDPDAAELARIDLREFLIERVPDERTPMR